MKLFLVKRLDDWGYDEFDSFVCAAKSSDDALKMHPIWDWNDDGKKDHIDTGEIPWLEKDKLSVTEIGESNTDEEKVIIASFNAG